MASSKDGGGTGRKTPAPQIARPPSKRGKTSSSSDDDTPSTPKKKAPAKKKAPTKPSPAAKKKAPAKKKATATKKKAPAKKKTPAKEPSSPPPSSFRDRLHAFGRWLRAEAIVWTVGASLGLVGVAIVLVAHARADVRAWLTAPPPRPPTVVWSAPVSVDLGEPYPVPDLVEDLLGAGLERAGTLRRPGEFVVDDDTVRAWLPEPPSETPSAWRGGRVTLRIDGQGVVRGLDPGAPVLLPPTRLAEIGDLDARRDAADLSRLPPHLPTALLAIEDARFRDHVGIDPVGIARALVSNLRSGNLQGGSTLTQQLAKNAFLSRDRTWRRKIREVFYAVALELELDKQQLLSRYLSEVYLGHVGGRPLHGVEQAARAWFGRSAEHLTLAQSATIVGTIASPNAWSPLRDHEAALRRRNAVLTRMVDIGALTHAEADTARDEPLTTLAAPPTASWRLPWAVDAILQRLDAGAEDAPGTGGHVHSTIQPHWQRAATQAVGQALAALAQDEPEASDAQAAMIAVDAHTGAVLAIVGGRDYADSPFPRALRARRQAGSTVKPLTLLAAMARDPALGPATPVDDTPLTIATDSGPWRPANVDRTFRGTIPLREAIAASRNLPAVRLAQQVGWRALRDTLHEGGLSGATAYPSTSLGAFETTAWEMAGAYTAFPGRGTAVRPQLVTRVQGTEGAGRTPKPATHRLADTTTTALATSILEAVVTEGTAKRLGAYGIVGPLGGKTGTSDEGRDAWFVGFDGRVVVAVWVGRDKGPPLGLGGSRAALPVFAHFAKAVGLPRTRLPGDPSLEAITVCRATGLLPCPDCEETTTSWFRRGQAPDGTGPCGPTQRAPRLQLPDIPDEIEAIDDPKARRQARRAYRRELRQGDPVSPKLLSDDPPSP